jgi:hypothetical protein
MLSYRFATFLCTPLFFAASLAAPRRSSLYGAGSEKAQPLFVDCALLDGNCSMNFLQNHFCWKYRKKTSFVACRDL